MSALTVAMLWVTITSARYVTVCMGHYNYVLATACPVQIKAHHHIDVYTDINNNKTLIKTLQKTGTYLFVVRRTKLLVHWYFLPYKAIRCH